jgi:hypothetical protein
MTLYKDEILDRLAQGGNVAQFVAFRPSVGDPIQSTSRVAGLEPNARFRSVQDAAFALLSSSADQSVNIRSYLPADPRSREFVYGLKSVDDILLHVDRLMGQGLHLILNETIDIADGGVSGVAHAGVIEFAPDDTPRAVEKPDVASLPRDMGLSILSTVYGFSPDIPNVSDDRIEFSIHPGPRGWKQTNTLLWEIEPDAGARKAPVARWPNRFSRHIGDKAFGLLVAQYLGMPVPATTVIPRRLAPFAFGMPTGFNQRWMRTCPRDPQPGLFTTTKGWKDPFPIMADEDPDKQIASVLSQQGVYAEWSGAAIVGIDGKVFIEGHRGDGDAFMIGSVLPERLPPSVLADVSSLHASLSEHLGPVRIEWVHDGNQPWIVQLHVGATQTSEVALVDGTADSWLAFDVSRGLSELRDVLRSIPTGVGLEIHGEIGLTSHIADVVRKWGRPARMIRH